jgi:hypothetical protein
MPPPVAGLGPLLSEAEMAIVEPPVESPPVEAAPPAASRTQSTALPSQSSSQAEPAKIATSSAPSKAAEQGEPEIATGDGEDELGTVGIVPDESKCFAARTLSIILVIAGLFTMGPAIYTLFEWVQGAQVVDIDRWVFVLLFLAGIHFLYASYLVHLPDWSSVWVVSFLMLVLSCLDALCLAGILLGDASGPVARALQISTLLRSKSMIWILCMLSVHGLLSYFCGREAIRWKRTFDVTISLFEKA